MEFNNGEIVEIINTRSSLDGKEVRVDGNVIDSENTLTVYIISSIDGSKFDTAAGEQTSIAMSEGCLKKK